MSTMSTPPGKSTRTARSKDPASGTPTPSAKRVAEAAAQRARARRRNRLLIGGVGGAVIVIAGLLVTFRASGGGSSGTNTGAYPFQVGQPGPGSVAPAISLTSTAGGTFDLASRRGRTVLLYFQEGISCEPCWAQIKQIEAQLTSIHGLGVDEVVSVTSDPVDQLRQKASDEGIGIAVLSDPDLQVSQQYHANDYGMMGNSRDGHSFIVVGPDGRIRWRADYGGAPNFTMDVPVDVLIQQLRTGLAAT